MKRMANRKLVLWMLVLALIVLAAPAAWAQRQGRGLGGFGNQGGGIVGLLAQKSVQEELKLSEDQVKQATQLVEKQRESLGGLRELSREERQKKIEEQTGANKTAVAGILKEDQLKRLNQISLQQRGGRALVDPQVAEALSLTSEQKDRVKSIQESVQGEMRALFQGGDRQAAQQKLAEIRKTSDEKLLRVLTPEQQGKWKELTGEPFKGEIVQPNFRGRNRAGAGAGRRNNANRSADNRRPAEFRNGR